MKCICFKTNVRIVLRNITMLVIILIGSMKAVAQEWDHEYFPFVEEGKVWNCHAVINHDDDKSLGQVLGYNGCYDSGTCPRDYTAPRREPRPSPN